VHEFEEKSLQKELDKLNTHDALLTREIFNNMVYVLLNHILKIIAALATKLNDTDINRTKLMNYSVTIVYRLSKFIRNEIDVKLDDLNILNQEFSHLDRMRSDISSKLESIQKSIDTQNAEINVILRNMIVTAPVPVPVSVPKKEIKEKKKTKKPKMSDIYNDSPGSSNRTLSLLKEPNDRIKLSELLDEIGHIKNTLEYKKGSDKSDILFLSQAPTYQQTNTGLHSIEVSNPQAESQAASQVASHTASQLDLQSSAESLDNSFIDVDRDDGRQDNKLRYLSTPSNPVQSVIDIE
jgi:hypothetical protein